MFLNNYSVRIPGGTEKPGQYVELTHGQTYKIALRNDNAVRCDAAVYVDGKHVGTWRIEARASITLERPAHDAGLFTFYQAGSTEAIAVGESFVQYSDRGLVRVVFTPEKIRPVTSYTYQNPASYYRSMGTYKGIDDYTVTNSTSEAAEESGVMFASASASPARSAGVTGLSGHSNQVFGQAQNIDYDYSRETTIFLRLVVADNGPRPLTQYSTPIPPAV